MDIIDKVKEKVEDKDLQIELLEDITDMVDPQEEMISKAEYDKLKEDLDIMTKKFDDLQNKYISRFGTSSSSTPNEVETRDEKLEEKKIIDVKDIFNEEKEE